MPHNSRFSPEEKERAVKDYLDGIKGCAKIANDLNVNEKTVRDWLVLFNNGGIDALTPKSKNKYYSAEIKLQAVQEYLTGKASLMDLMRKYNLSNKKIAQNWVKQYNSHGEFKSKQTGSEIYMAKGRKTSFEERQEIVAYCISRGNDYRAAMEQYSVSYQQIYGWVKSYQTEGVEGLKDRRGRAKPEEQMTEEDRLRAENRMLKAQLYEKQMENDVIKKLNEVKGRRG